jgi:branched-chain amino acid aminotransferase
MALCFISNSQEVHMLKPFAADAALPPQEAGWDENLRFVYSEVDAFWLTRWTAGAGWEPGHLYEHRGARLELSPGAAVLYYGEGVFEGLKAYRTRAGKIVLFRPQDNARRLRASAARLVLPPPPVGCS